MAQQALYRYYMSFFFYEPFTIKYRKKKFNSVGKFTWKYRCLSL